MVSSKQIETKQNDVLSPYFKQQAKLERKLHDFVSYKISIEERAHIPTDFPDVMSFSNLGHVLALIGVNARYSAEELSNISKLVKKSFAVKVDRFKYLGDSLFALKDRFKKDPELGPSNVEYCKITTIEMEQLLAQIEKESKEIKEMISRLRVSMNGFAKELDQDFSSDLGSVGKNKKNYPMEGAEWICAPIRTFHQYFPSSNSIKDFASWCSECMHDDIMRRFVEEMLSLMGAVSCTGIVNKKLIEDRVKEYMKYFKSSLPKDCVLRP